MVTLLIHVVKLIECHHAVKVNIGSHMGNIDSLDIGFAYERNFYFYLDRMD